MSNTSLFDLSPGGKPSSSYTFLSPVSPPQEYDRHTILQSAQQWQSAYSRHSIPSRSNVIILLDHSLDLHSSFTGAILSRLVPAYFAPPSAKYSQEAFLGSIGVLVNTVNPAAIVTTSRIASILPPSLIKDIAVIRPDEVAEPRIPVKQQVIEYSEDDTAFIQFSSGTTGIKKGVAISFKSLFWQVKTYTRDLGINENDRIISWLPLYHDMGLITAYWIPLLHNIPLVSLSPLDWVKNPVSFMEALSDFQGTLGWLPNFAYHHITAHTKDEHLAGLDLSGLRGLINCSEPVRRHTHVQFLKKFRPAGIKPSHLWSCYAMAENTFAVTSCSSPPLVNRIDRDFFRYRQQAIPAGSQDAEAIEHVSSGRPLPETHVAILDKNGSSLPDDFCGEIAIKSPSLFSGYYNNTSATSETLREGWFLTGDTGYSHKGHLFITGRQKDTIIVNGKNICPDDIEYLLHDIPALIKGRVVAFGMDNERRGTEDIIVLAETASPPDTHDSIKVSMQGRIHESTDITPADIRLLPHGWLVKSTSGKISRSANRRRYAEEFTAAGTSSVKTSSLTDPSDTTERITRVIRDVLKKSNRQVPATLSSETKLITGGVLDSLSLVDFILSLEDEFGFTIPDKVNLDLDALDSIPTLKTYLHTLRSRLSPRQLKEQRQTTKNIRQYKCDLLKRSACTYDVLLLGSSKSLPIHTSSINSYGYHSFNFSVSSANAEDWYCCFSFAAKWNGIPFKKLIICLDIESFSPHFSIDPRLYECPDLSAFLFPDHLESVREIFKKQEEKQDFLRKMRALGSISYTFDNHGNLQLLSSTPQHALLNQRRPVSYTGDADSKNAEYTLKFKDFSALDRLRLLYFYTLIDTARRAGTQTILFLPPVQKDFTRFLDHNTTYLDRLNEFKSRFPSDSDDLVRLFDFSSTEYFNGKEHDFIDPVHMGTYNADRVMAGMFDILQKE